MSTCEYLHQLYVLLLHRGVPMVFNGVVSPSWQHLCHLSPFVAMSCMCQKQDPLFVGHPLNFQDIGVKVVVPPLSALLAQPPLNELGDEGPTLRSMLLNQFPNQVILCFSPRFLAKKLCLRVLRFSN